MWRTFFPFSTSYKHLGSFWWHRLFQVLFAIGVIFSIVFLWSWGNRPYIDSYRACLEAASQPPQIDPSFCKSLPVPSGENFAIALLITLVLSYLAQAIYYKGLVYIILGKENNQQ